MKLTKITGSFNEYRLEVSWGELEAIYEAMAQSHAGPVADEVYSGLKWYMDSRLPLPGEDDKKKKDGKDDVDAEADARLPDPDEFAQLDRPAPESPARLAQVEPGAGDDDEPGDDGDGGAEDDDDDTSANSRLPKPPPVD